MTSERLVYRCNGITAWWLTPAGIAALHVTGIFPLQTIFERFGAFMVVAMILHRASRDVARCKRKYGADWDRYTREVPYLFIPKVF